MKKYIFMFLIVICAFLVEAQSPGNFEAFVADTTTDVETIYMAVASPVPITYDYSLAMYLIPTNESGTATVTAMPQWSPDNSVWFDLQADVDTINDAGSAVDLGYFYTNSHGRYYRIKLVSSGTGVTSFLGALGIKRKR